MFFVHLIFLLLADFYIYNLEILIIIADIILIWLDYYNFMTLKKITVLIGCGLQAIIVLVSVSHIQRILSGDLDWLLIIFYFLQFIVVYPFSLILILYQFKKIT